MKVKLGNIKPNPYRKMGRYPIDREKVEALKISIEETSFWDNILARPDPEEKEKIQIAYGHHRYVALQELDIPEIDIPVRNLDDATMICVMANENMESWGSSPRVVNETVWTAKEFLEDVFRKCNNINNLQKSYPSVYKTFISYCNSTEKTRDENVTFGHLRTGAIKSKEIGIKGKFLRAFLGRNWKEWHISQAIDTVEADEKGEIDKDAVEEFKELEPSSRFKDAVREYKIPKKKQRKIAKDIVTSGIGKRAIRDYVRSTKIVHGGPSKVEKKEEPAPDLMEWISETTSLMSNLEAKLSKIKPYSKYIASGYERIRFYSQVRALQTLLNEVVLWEKGES